MCAVGLVGCGLIGVVGCGRLLLEPREDRFSGLGDDLGEDGDGGLVRVIGRFEPGIVLSASDPWAGRAAPAEACMALLAASGCSVPAALA